VAVTQHSGIAERLLLGTQQRRQAMRIAERVKVIE